MHHEVLAHPLCPTPSEGVLERAERKPRAFDGAERDDHDALRSVVAGRRERDEADGAVAVAHADAGYTDPVVRLRLGDEVENVAARHDHQPLPSIGIDAYAVGLGLGDPGRPNQQGHGAELVEGEKTWLGLALNGERSLEF